MVRGIVAGRGANPGPDRLHGRGAALAACGTALALAGGLGADGFLKDSPAFQQVRFGIYFCGFDLVVLGTCWMLRAVSRERLSFRRVLPGALAGLFVAAVAVSIPFLLVASGVGAGFLAVAATRSSAPGRVILVAVFEALLFIGLLREAQIVPDLGDPLVNLLASFVPFLIGGIAIAIAAGMRQPRNPVALSHRPVCARCRLSPA